MTPLLSPATHMGLVALRVADLPRQVAFYEQVVGLQVQVGGDTAVFTTPTPDNHPLIQLQHTPHARPPQRRTTGLFHLALLVPTRRDLAAVARHLWQNGIELGASDHLVSEALYFDDPEGNGIEIYADRPREQWPVQNGVLQMATLPLNFPSLLSELADSPTPSAPFRLPAGTRMGHVHLRVADIPRAKQFYGDVLGFSQMVDYGSQATFYAAGGYHHHLGMNTWQSFHAPPPAPDETGLDYFTIHTPDVAAVQQRLAEQGVGFRVEGDGLRLADPFGNGIYLSLLQVG
jgi:catechol 2,3-dioxygenase